MNRNPVSAKLTQENLSRPLATRSAGSYCLLTGATGLVGRYLIRDLIAAGRKLVVIVRPSSRLTAEERIENILQRWEQESGTSIDRPVVFQGDINAPDLGLDQEQLNWLERNCDTVIHNAAILKFKGASLEHEPWRTNLTGTKNVLSLANRTGIHHLHYVSTAYVCGSREDTVFEDELECGQEFRNDYEQSKYRAEQLVHEAAGFSSKTIYRPGVIVGDSETGYTSTYHGLYLYLRLLATLVPQQKRNAQGQLETPIRLPFHGDEPRNLVTVDWVSQVISHIVCNPEAHGRTFHLIPDQGMTAKQLLDHCFAFFNSTGAEFVGQTDPNAGNTSDASNAGNEFAEMFFQNAQIYEDYLTSDPDFDKSNVNQFAGHIECPMIDRGMVYRFIEFGTQDRWGKRRERQPEVKRWFQSEIESVVGELNSADLEFDNRLIGLNIKGPGGGQWQLAVNGQGSFVVDEGLPIESVETLNLDHHQIDSILAAAASDQTNVWSTLFHQLLT